MHQQIYILGILPYFKAGENADIKDCASARVEGRKGCLSV
jgi:hypothetical protein